MRLYLPLDKAPSMLKLGNLYAMYIMRPEKTFLANFGQSFVDYVFNLVSIQFEHLKVIIKEKFQIEFYLLDLALFQASSKVNDVNDMSHCDISTVSTLQ